MGTGGIGPVHDGLEGITCEDCGAYLQWIVVNGNDYLRCPWAGPGHWLVDSNHEFKRIYCQLPSGERTPGGMPTIRRRPD